MCYLKLTLVLITFLIICSCVSKDSGERLLKSSIKPAENKAVVNDTGTLPNIAQQPEDDISPAPAKFNLRSPHQTKSRRTKIKFPDDCTDITGAGEKIELLPAACAEALRSARPALKEAADEGECDRPIADDNNHAYPVIDSDKILSYKIKNSAETDISILTKKLGTVFENLAENNELDYSAEFRIGQELKYQKAHYIYEFEPKFLSLSNNKYLVEIRCWTAAYNLSNIYLLYNEAAIPAKAQVLEFDWVQPESHIYDDFSYLKPPSDDYIAKYTKIVKEKTLCGFYFNPKTKLLIAYSKGNGMGAFGQYARYSLKNPSKPKLEEFRAKFYDNVYTYKNIYNPDHPLKLPPNYGYDDVIKRPPKTWKRYYPK